MELLAPYRSAYRKHSLSGAATPTAKQQQKGEREMTLGLKSGSALRGPIRRLLGLSVSIVLSLSFFPVRSRAGEVQGSSAPGVELRKADLIKFTGSVDCNSPGHWDGNTLYVFNSAPKVFRSSGAGLLHLGPAAATRYTNEANGGRWIEATHKAKDGKLYGWYHNEPHPVCPAKHDLTAPRIGAAVSADNGATWNDLGFVLEAPADSLFCETPNHYFAGGNGDFSVIVDNKSEYVYFLISTYNKDVSEQGVAVARMLYADRDAPVGRVWKWRNGKWDGAGIGGHVSPIFPVKIDWNRKDADTFWGPSIHWNSFLSQYVVLLNRAIDKDWLQEGVYISFNADLGNPAKWSTPRKILDSKEIKAVPEMGPGWYPQVMGIDGAKRETDKLAGRVARLFVHGKSVWEIEFSHPKGK